MGRKKGMYAMRKREETRGEERGQKEQRLRDRTDKRDEKRRGRMYRGVSRIEYQSQGWGGGAQSMP